MVISPTIQSEQDPKGDTPAGRSPFPPGALYSAGGRMDNQLNGRVTALRIAFGLTATLAGLDKFFNLLADWSAYVSPLAVQLLPVSAETFMQVVGVVELVVGAALLGAAPIAGAYAASAWLLLVAVNLVLSGHLDVAVRDGVMAIGALTLARLLEIRQEAPAPAAVAASTNRRVTA